MIINQLQVRWQAELWPPNGHREVFTRVYGMRTETVEFAKAVDRSRCIKKYLCGWGFADIQVSHQMILLTRIAD